MMRSLYSGISGLRNHQTRMDVIGNNIANVNTAGFKSSRTIFQDIYSQTSRSAAAPVTGGLGGTNPMQIGLGVKLATIDVLHTSAAIQRTDRELDLMIEGDGFFVVSSVAPDAATEDQDVPGVYVPDDSVPDASEVVPLSYTRAGNFYLDSRGYLVTASGMYVLGVRAVADAATGGTASGFTVPGSGANDEITAANLERIWVDMTAYSSISFDDKGNLQGVNTAGVKEIIGTAAVATFINPGGLEKMGSSLYAETPNSGQPGGIDGGAFFQSGTGGAGKLVAGGMEMSNVDLASEFTDMIVTQRGFQANSRIITVSDTLLEELVNLKR
ncbi:MAG: flagellar hook-basal body complex protein [Oscillospiraceae bacterium]|jgi:flagellar hook protein FlgE|nr:flagellar hook-basal body complex protein [Oscillospiraceae bacterium]